MTDQHPLTNEICDKLSIKQLSKLDYDYESINFAEDVRSDMRAAADYQLEQVIEWLKDNVSHSLLLEAGLTALRLDLDWITDDLKQAMRPTTQEDN